MFRRRARAELSLAERLSYAFTMVAVLIGAMVAIAGSCFALVLGHFEPSISGLLAGQNGVNEIHQGMLDQETGLRGFLDSGDVTFLQPYTVGRAEIATGEEATLGIATRDDLAAPILDMRVAERRWADEWAAPALSLVSASGSPAQKTAFLLSGKALFDAYRVAQTTADRIVNADISGEQASEHTVVAVGLGLAAAALLATTIAFRRQKRGLDAATVAPVADLLSTMRSVREGDLEARPSGIGPPELREVATGLARMTDALVAERSRIAALEATARSQADRLQLIIGVGREIAGSLNVRYVSEAVAQAAIGVTGLDTARIWLVDESQAVLTPVHDTAIERGQQVHGDLVRLGDGLVGRVGQYGRILSSRPDGSVATEHRADLPTAALAVPMIVAARVIGVLELTSDRPHLVDEPTLDVLRSLAGQAATAIEAARLHNRADEMSHTDVLTGLPNRRRLEADLASEVARSLRYQRPLAFIMLDVDHFKDFNDLNGHQVGDEILAEFGRSLADALRDTDTAYRYGGEEFCLLLRETDAGAALAVAERLRSSVASRFTDTNGSRAVTASLGVASLLRDATDAASLVAAADQALYAAKAAGRDRVASAAPLAAARVRVRGRPKVVSA